MKKLFILSLVCIFAFALVGCKKKSNSGKVVNDASLIVENVISTDRQDMFLHASKDFTWYETTIKLKNFLDSEDTSSEVTDIVNVFQVVNEHEKSADAVVWIYDHAADTYTVNQYSGFWVGDHSLNTEEIKLTFEDAYNKLQEANCEKPHSQYCVLRRIVGTGNTMYIFGNARYLVYVNATTGEVTLTDPVGPEE